ISPPSADRKKYGAMNTAAASVIRDSAASPPILNRIRKTRAFFRKLSLNAEKNWHQNRGANRRDHRRDLDCTGDGSVMGAAYVRTQGRYQSRGDCPTSITLEKMLKTERGGHHGRGFRGGRRRRSRRRTARAESPLPA